jgi:hypothetical protein
VRLIVRERLRSANQNAASFGFLFALFVGCAFLHFVAHFKMEMGSRNFLAVNGSAIREMAVIDFIDAHQWIAVVYFAACLGLFGWLVARMAPEWLFRISASALAIPCSVYLSMCIHIADKIIDWSAVPR